MIDGASYSPGAVITETQVVKKDDQKNAGVSVSGDNNN